MMFSKLLVIIGLKGLKGIKKLKLKKISILINMDVYLKGLSKDKIKIKKKKKRSY
jgi:hypothetical protein